MARKQPDVSGIFQKTEPAPTAEETPAAPAPAQRSAAPEELDRTLPVGVGLKTSELRELDRIADRLGVKRNGLMRYAIRYFLAEYKAGRVTVPVEREERTRIAMD